MIALITAIFLSTVIAFISTVHGLGFWLLLMIMHGALVAWFGDAAVHIPLYCGIGITIIILIKRKWHGVPGWVLWLFGIVITLMSLSTLLAYNIDLSLIYFLLYCKNFILALLIAGCTRRIQDMRTLSLYCLLGLAIGGIIAIYQYLTGQMAVSTIYDQRAAGLRSDSNDTAMLLLTGIPLALYWFTRARLPGKLLSLAACGLVLIGIILTGSRGGFVALCIVVLLIYLRRPRVANTVAGILILVMSIAFAPAYYKNRMSTLLTGKETNYATSLDERGKLLHHGIKALFQHPLLGAGPGNFGAAYLLIEAEENPMANSGNPTTAPHIAAHNMYLEFLVENGLITGIFYIAIFASALIGLLKMREANFRGNRNATYPFGFLIGSGLLAMLFAGLFLSQGNNSVLWFIVGLGLASYQIKRPAYIPSAMSTKTAIAV